MSICRLGIVQKKKEEEEEAVSGEHWMFFSAALWAAGTTQIHQRGREGNDSVRLDSDRVIVCRYEHAGEA